PPDLFHVTPNHADVGGGTTVQLLGSGFSGGDEVEVLFGDVPSPVVQLEDDQLLLAEVPPSLNLGSVSVTVTNTKGSSEKSAAFSYTQDNGSDSSYGFELYPEACLVDGTTDGSQSTIQVSGGPFDPDKPTRFFIDGEELDPANVEVVSEGLLTFLCPPHDAGKVDIVFTQGPNHFQQDQTFQYIPYGGPGSDGDLIVNGGTYNAHGDHPMAVPLNVGDTSYAIPLVEPITILPGDELLFRNRYEQPEGERGQWGRATVLQVLPNMPTDGEMEIVFTEPFATASGDEVPISGRFIDVPQYTDLIVVPGAVLRADGRALVVDVVSTLLVDGTMSMSEAYDGGCGAACGASGSGGGGSCGSSSGSGGG
ncbi:MAG: IPT/TIG domain-containing protein, partial [Myxococcota bacterium]|nr:IPT/TIG domain-containing protein [Myxococcota bacterium]